MSDVVFVVMNGERCEGGSVCGVFRAEADAVAFALTIETAFGGGWMEEDKNVWSNGCDLVSVERWEVTEEMP
jgi:hypothetical protein